MRTRKCKICGNCYHWHHAFSKFGYDDGEGDIQTHNIARELERAGYSVRFERWLLHNMIITSIKKHGHEYMPLDNPDIRIGYDDPSTYLPEEILDLLNHGFTPEILFRADNSALRE